MLNMASMVAMFGVPIQSTYSASKYAVRGFTAALRVECAPLGVGVSVSRFVSLFVALAGVSRFVNQP